MKDLFKEEKDLIKALSIESAQPDPYFKNKLKNKFINKYYTSSFSLRNFTTGLLAAAFLSLFVIIVGINLFNPPLISTDKITTNFSKEEKTVILANILKNNSVSILQSNISKSSDPGPQDKNEIYTIQKNFTDNYYLAEYTTLTQIYSEKCSQLNINEGTTTFSEFRDQNRYFSLTVQKDRNNQITYYGLNKIKSNLFEEYIYTGTSPAIKTTGKISESPAISYPLSYNQDPEDEDIFANSVLEQRIKKDGEEFYVLRSEILINCNNEETLSYPSSYTNSKSKIITLRYFNIDTFNVEREETYINSESIENLLYTQSFLKKEKQVAVETIEREFEYTLNIPVATDVLPASYINVQFDSIE